MQRRRKHTIYLKALFPVSLTDIEAFKPKIVEQLFGCALFLTLFISKVLMVEFI